MFEPNNNRDVKELYHTNAPKHLLLSEVKTLSKFSLELWKKP